ncbi:ribonuclease P protein component [Candidatus Parcubacteria bacterium]|nr:ribonuclease P protein component [Patescibacteria group bacterium]MBU4381243.1 ribonuclease P protein component [Patescibacteria group bacterium]MCG2689275.1 ribonuclease P protein component [Candidatus Parcubacteria bacterium]
MLPAEYRLLDDYDFRRVKRLGRSYNFPFFIIACAHAKNPKGLRFGFIFSTNFNKRATVRNRYKRLLRQGVQKRLNEFKLGFDIVFIPKKSILGRSYEEISHSFDTALPKTPLV